MISAASIALWNLGLFEENVLDRVRNHNSLVAIATDTLQSVIAQAVDSVTSDTLYNIIAQEQIIPDTTTTDTTHKMEIPHYDIADLFPNKPVIGTSHQNRWSIDLAYVGGMGEQNYNRPYSFTEMPTLVISGEPPSPVTFENWSDYAAFLAENPDDGRSHTRSVIMNIALNNANQPGNDKIVRKSHHYMPISFSLALKYKLSNRFSLETGRVYLIRLGWLLTSSHPKYRALTMRMIRKQLNSHTDVILWLLKLFEKVNDPYVVAGLYCAVAGVVLTTRNEELAGSIAEYIYKTFYGQAETVPQDLIVRQWTMKIIERAYALDEHNDCWSKIQTPFAALPFDEDKITPYEDINRDYFGMQHGSRLMYNSIFGFEDFNRYIIGTNNRHRSSDYFKYDEIGGVYLGDDLTREEAEIAYYIKNVFGWNDKLGSLDNGKYSVDRSHNDEERIGKKFQWLAWFRLNARLMDSYKVTRSSYHYSDKAKEDELTPTPYPWNTSEVTYFDPTLDVEVYNSYNKLLSGVEALEVIGIQDESWIDNNKYVPTFRNQVIVEGSTPFVMLRGFDKATGGDKETVVITNAAFVKKSDSEAFAEWCRDKNFYGRWMPERNGMYEFLWNDYPWADAYYNAIELPAWERPSNGSPCDVMLAYEAQLQEHWEGIAYEDEYLTTVYMPCVEMMKEMGLYNSDVRGIVKLQTDDTIAAINSSKEDGVTGLFVRKDILDEFLRRKNYVLFYYVRWAASQNRSQKALEKFLRPDAADIFLVSYAATDPNNYTVVSFEVSNHNGSSEFKLPDVCNQFGVKCIPFQDMFRELNETY